QTQKIPEATLATESTRAAASIAAAKDLWTQPKEASPPLEGPDAPAPQAVGEPWSRQAIVALILHWCAEGLTKTAITARLNTAHVPPLSGKRGWNIHKVNSALRAAPQGKKARQTFLAQYTPPNPVTLGREG